MYNWKKLGKVFNPRDFNGLNWMKDFAQAPSTLLKKDCLRVYFSCRPSPDDKGQFVSYSSYVDLDLDNLFKIKNLAKSPILKLGGLGEFDEFGTYPVSVIRDKKTVRAFYGGWTRCESVPFNVAIGSAISYDDGDSFEKVGKGPILSYSQDEPFVISGPKIRKFNNMWYLFYIAGRKWKIVKGRPEPVYKIRMAISKDANVWTKINQDLIESRIEEDEAQASPDVFYDNNKYHMFFCYRYSSNYRNHERGYRIGYATSFDLINWTRQDEMGGINVSDSGWDSEMISYPHVFKHREKTYMAYLGNEVGRYGFGLAELNGSLT